MDISKYYKENYMTEDSKVYQLYCEIINDIYSNAYDDEEAFNIISKLSELVDLLDPNNIEHPKIEPTDDKYFPSEPE